MDTKFMGPKIAAFAENPSDDDDLGSFHMATFPKDLPPDIRNAALKHIARVVSNEEVTS